ncbi:MAG: hypothetical protein AAB091_05910, partial [Elusimicrobiota bacterium]
IAAAEILPENLPAAWKDVSASGLAISTALSVKVGKTLPWKTVRGVISSALQARFLELTPDSKIWPCDLAVAQFAKFKVAIPIAAGGFTVASATGSGSKALIAAANLEPSQVQELGDIVPKLLAIKTKANVPIRFHVQVEMGDGKTPPPPETVTQANTLLKNVNADLQLR